MLQTDYGGRTGDKSAIQNKELFYFYKYNDGFYCSVSQIQIIPEKNTKKTPE